MQLSIDFIGNRIDKGVQNNIILQSNKGVFSNQCMKVLEHLNKGERLTTTTALRYGIGDLRARCRDLIKFGVPVQKTLLEGRYKEYYLKEPFKI